MMRAIFFVGGWRGHRPTVFAEWAKVLLQQQGYDVEIFDTLEPLTDPAKMQTFDLIVPIWSSARSGHRPEFGNMTREQEAGLMTAVEGGIGLAGWHGHMGDAFRDRPNYHFMVGGQFVGHPPGWPDNPDSEADFIDYQVNIAPSGDPIVAGLDDFWVHGEQYYMHVDPSNTVLATTTFSGEYLPWIEGCLMPVVWKRRWGQGRVFYCSIGHTVDELNIPEVNVLMKRGLRWASRKAEIRD
ncbi:MAG: ThuA domain-containing protein [Anaerolineae bacterium]|nr:ThuA domain-containing protein [Anaerolineae bacterium]